MKKIGTVVFRKICRTFCSSITSQSLQVGELLLVSHITKVLSKSGIQSLETDLIPLSNNLVLDVLGRASIDPSKKIDFFNWCAERHDYRHSAETYSKLLQVLVCSCRAHEYDHVVRDVFSAMKRDGVHIESPTFKLVLDALIHSGKIDSALQVVDHMEELGAKLDPRLYNSVVIALVRRNHIGSALSMCIKLVEISSGSCDPLACNELLVSLRRAKMKEEFKKLFSILRENNIGLDTWGYNICIYSFGCWGDLETSLSLFKEMKEFCAGGPDLCTYNSLLHVLCLVGKVKDALVVWEELKDSGLEPDAFTYRILIQGCCKSFRVEDATKVFNEMQCKGFNPDVAVYNTLLDGFLKARRLTEACQLFEKMNQEDVRATRWTYNILIDGLIKNGRAIAGYTLFCDLKKKGEFVDGVTYSIIILHLCREGLINEALLLVEEMEGRGFVVDLVTITSLLIGLHKYGQWDSSDRLMRHIRDGSLLQNVLRWGANMETSLKYQTKTREDFTPIFPAEGDFVEIVDMLANENDGECLDSDSGTEDVDEWSSSPYMDRLTKEVVNYDNGQLFKWFSISKGQRVDGKGINSFHIDMVNTYLSIFLSKGKLSTACKLFEIFTDMGSDPVSYTYNSLMSLCMKKGYFDQTWGILHEMGENLCPADIATYNIIIQSLGKVGRADLASSVLDKLLKEGGYLDIVMYNTLMNALGKASRVDQVVALFEQMRKSGVNPDVVTFNTLIEVHTKAGKMKDAHKFLKMMIDAGCSPNHVTDTILDKLGNEMNNF